MPMVKVSNGGTYSKYALVSGRYSSNIIEVMYDNGNGKEYAYSTSSVSASDLVTVSFSNLKYTFTFNEDCTVYAIYNPNSDTQPGNATSFIGTMHIGDTIVGDRASGPVIFAHN